MEKLWWPPLAALYDQLVAVRRSPASTSPDELKGSLEVYMPLLLEGLLHFKPASEDARKQLLGQDKLQFGTGREFPVQKALVQLALRLSDLAVSRCL